LLVLGCLLVFVGWLNLQSAVKWLVAMVEQRSVDSGNESKRILESGSGSSSRFMECFPGPRIQTVMTSLTFGFLVLSLILSVSSAARLNADMQEREHKEIGPYNIMVHQKIDSRHAVVQDVDDSGNLQNQPWKLAVCPHEWTPSFDANCTYEVAFELTSTEVGICESFTGRNAKAREINCR
jgi:hypothetical protein